MRQGKRSIRIFLTVIFSTTVACSNVNLVEQVELTGTSGTVDDEVSFQVEICTAPSTSDRPPFKLVGVMDRSFSINVTDPSNKIITETRKLFETYRYETAFNFLAIKFNNLVERLPSGQSDASFTNDPMLLQMVLNELGVVSGRTNILAAVSEAATAIREDIDRQIELDDETLCRTEYRGFLFSDGAYMVELNDLPTNPTVCDGINPPGGSKERCLSLYELWLDCSTLNPGFFAVPIYECIADGATFGSPAWLENLITLFDVVLQPLRDLKEYAEDACVPPIRFDSLLLGNLATLTTFLGDADQAAKELAAAELLMETLANENNGEFVRALEGEDIDFSKLGFAPIENVPVIRGFFVVNTSAVYDSTLKRFIPDSDRDGLSDSFETGILGTNPLLRDSDGDGCSDLLEERHPTLDPLRKDCKPTAAVSFVPDICETSIADEDPDEDGITNCEEAWLQTRPDEADSDRDGIPDPLELRFDTNPIVSDSDLDPDLDGAPNSIEIARGSLTKLADSTDVQRHYEYRTESLQTVPDSSGGVKVCLAVDVRNVGLIQTTAVPSLEQKLGENHLEIFFVESTPTVPGSPTTVRKYKKVVRYISGDEGNVGFRDPADPTLKAKEGSFTTLGE